MKAERINMPSRTVRFSELPVVHPSDRKELMVGLAYEGYSNLLDGVAMDDHVLPQIVRAVNCHDELVAALEGARHLVAAEYRIRADGELGKLYLGELLKRCDAALAKAKGSA